MKRVTVIIILFLIATSALAQSKKQIVDFRFEGTLLNGVLNLPKDQQPKGIVLLVHGSGKTNAVAQDWYADIRETVVKAGYAIYMWDKMGCGKSGGTFHYNQPVHHSASEVIAAINTLKEKQIPGSEVIGLLGFSRAGWINPIVINQYDDIAFWISVSGVDDKENFGYLLGQNLRINGMPQDSVDLLVSQWVEGTRITHSGGSFESYLQATEALRYNPFWLRFTNGTSGEQEEESAADSYYSNQAVFMKEKLDEETGLQVLVEDFEPMLSTVNIPVLALFGARDMNVDWRKTKLVYERTLGQHTDLVIKSFPNCNHNMLQCETGGFYEFQDYDLPRKRCEGFLDAIESWLHDR